MATSMVGTTGLDSLQTITESISSWLGADCVMVGEIMPDAKHVKVLSMLLDGKKITDYSYPLKGTPCDNVTEKGFCLYPDDVADLFPKSRHIRDLNIRGYAGTPVWNAEGFVIGIVCIMTRKPLSLPPNVREILDIIAVKAGAEIERRRMEEAVQNSEKKFSLQFAKNPSLAAITDFSNGKLFDVNEAFVKATGYSRDELIGRTTRELNLFANFTDREQMVQTLSSEGAYYHKQIEFRRKSGEIRLLDFYCYRIRLGEQV